MQKDGYAGTRASSWTPLHHESSTAVSCDEGSRSSGRISFLYEYFDARGLFRHGSENRRGRPGTVAFENAERDCRGRRGGMEFYGPRRARRTVEPAEWRSEEHTSELQSRLHLVCRLLLEKKKPSPRNASHPNRLCTDPSIRRP